MSEATWRWKILEVIVLGASAAGAALIYGLFLRRAAVAFRRDRAAMRWFWLIVVAVLAIPALWTALSFLSTLIHGSPR